MTPVIRCGLRKYASSAWISIALHHPLLKLNGCGEVVTTTCNSCILLLASQCLRFNSAFNHPTIGYPMDAASVEFDDIADYGDADDSSEPVPDEVLPSVTNNSIVGANIPAEAIDKIPNIRSGPFVSLPNKQPPTDEDIPMPAVSTRSKTARLQQEFLSSDIRSSPAPSSSPPALVEGTHDSNSNSPNRSESNSATMQDENDEENQRDIPVVVAGVVQSVLRSLGW